MAIRRKLKRVSQAAAAVGERAANLGKDEVFAMFARVNLNGLSKVTRCEPTDRVAPYVRFTCFANVGGEALASLGSAPRALHSTPGSWGGQTRSGTWPGWRSSA